MRTTIIALVLTLCSAVSVTAQVSIQITQPPAGFNLIPGVTRRVFATVTNGTTNQVNWTVLSGDAVLSSSSGPYVDVTAGNTGSSCQVSGHPVQASAVVQNGVITDVKITNDGGQGYLYPPTVDLSHASGTGASISTTISNGSVTGFVVSAGGSGYASTTDTSYALRVGYNDIQPYSISSAKQFIVQAQSVDDPTKNATALFNVCSPAVQIWADPFYEVLYANQPADIQSFVWGSVNENVTWAITAAPAGGDGSLSDNSNRDVVFSASVPGRYTLTATSLADPSKTATATLFVTGNARPYATTQNGTEPVDCTIDPQSGGPVFDIGPDWQYPTINSVMTQNGLPAVFAPGTTIRIHNDDQSGSNPTTYHELIIARGQGTPSQPIRVVGCPDAKGNLPVIDGANASGPSDYLAGYAVFDLHSKGWATYPNTSGPARYFVVEGLRIIDGYQLVPGAAPLAYKGAYSSTKSYAANDLVLSGSSYLAANSSLAPSSSTNPNNWTDVTNTSINWWYPAATWQGKYVAATDYKVNDVVSYNGSNYIALVDPPIGTAPTNAAYWTMTPVSSTQPGGPGITTPVAWSPQGMCLRISEADNLLIRGNDLEHCGDAGFADFNQSNSYSGRVVDLTWQGNRHNDYGMVGGSSFHAAYLQGFRQVIQFNNFLTPHAGATSAQLKSRGVANIIRYNNFLALSGVGRVIDLVDQQDAPAYMSFDGYVGGGTLSQYTPSTQYSADLVASAFEAWHHDYVYGNTFTNVTSRAIVHYFGDNLGGETARVGSLWFYNNSLHFPNAGPWSYVSPVDTAQNGDNWTRFEWPQINLYNNAFYIAVPNQPYFSWSKLRSDFINFGRNWISSSWGNNNQNCIAQYASSCYGTGWPSNSEGGLGSYQDGNNLPAHVTGFTLGQNILTGNSAPFDLNSFVPTSGSPLFGSGSMLPAAVSNLPVRFQFNPVSRSYYPRTDLFTIGALDSNP